VPMLMPDTRRSSFDGVRKARARSLSDTTCMVWLRGQPAAYRRGNHPCREGTDSPRFSVGGEQLATSISCRHFGNVANAARRLRLRCDDAEVFPA
jgi:hypothetical protein